MPSTKFKVGDKVKVLDNVESKYRGEGVVIEVYLTMAVVRLESDHEYSYYHSELEKIKEKPVVSVGNRVKILDINGRPVVNVGDRVKVDYEGTVKYISQDGWVSVSVEGKKYSVTAPAGGFTVVAPPFPTKPGSVIKATWNGITSLYIHNKYKTFYVWHSVLTGENFKEDQISLVSIEYVPED